ncbi:hypothetical protein F4805DRAFT_456117 [Annulohypoxylon moriforme]|nr:hypothetical protein F4805DRAFT_456117 [Annulohypoxylon moriforme]
MAHFYALLATLLLGVTHASYLNLTALTGRNNVSVIECWQLKSPLVEASPPGARQLDMGGLESATYAVSTGNLDFGLHNAPCKQWVWIMSGVMEFSLPNGTDTARVYGGNHGLVFADDTKDISGWGHQTIFYGEGESVGVFLPTKDNVVPEHTVLYSGPCTVHEQAEVDTPWLR